MTHFYIGAPKNQIPEVEEVLLNNGYRLTSLWDGTLAQRLILCCADDCVGGIFVDGYEAYEEKMVLRWLRRPVFVFSNDGGPLGLPQLTSI